MNAKTEVKGANPLLIKPDPTEPALIVTGRKTIAIKAGVSFAGRSFAHDTPVPSPDAGLDPGGDYAVVVVDGEPSLIPLTVKPIGDITLGGFHFAPGGNAAARQGGDDVPAINPWSVWDLNYRPACPDPRGMALIDAGGPKYWADIYLTGADHLTNGTSKLGVTICDGDDPP
ncbi:MAG: hypothetical protein QOD40_3265, partial [Alphaproteobacteria bacterium]|nr:hypothetical protein [Alphaproteobacteria bacterium]